MADFHGTFDKTINDLNVKSYGGGSPRWVTIKNSQAELYNLSMDECRDLQYMLSRLLEEYE